MTSRRAARKGRPAFFHEVSVVKVASVGRIPRRRTLLPNHREPGRIRSNSSHSKSSFGYDLAASHPAVHAWLGRVAALPGWRAPYDLLPGKRLRSYL